MNESDASQATIRTRRMLLGAAIGAARDAATLVRDRAASIASLDWRVKSHADFVSDVDTAAEETIRRTLARRVPGSAIIGEELSPGARAESGVVFVVDPLDGTTNFLHGYPWYAVSIAALVDGQLAAAVVLNVPTGETFTAIAGDGARRNDAPISVSTIVEPERALIGTGFPFKNPELATAYARQFAEIMPATSGIRRAGSAALDLADVACGRFEAFWELVLFPWDYAAGVLLVREAGGLITTLDGSPIPTPFARSAIVAGNPTMHRWLLTKIRSTNDG